jgi:hypothetical protein
MIDNISNSAPACEDCKQSKWGVQMLEDGELVQYCIVCSGDIVHTKEARDAAQALLEQSAE